MFTKWLGFLCLTVFTVAGQAAVIYTGTGDLGGVHTNGTATFTINSNSITIELENTGGVGQVQDIGSELGGISFTLVGGSAVFDDTSLTALATAGVNCTSGTCVSSTLPASPYGWKISGTSSFQLSAGGSSLKPDAIVNDNIAVADGVANAQHNPLLMGPVDFTIDFTGVAPTDIGSVTFLFGTGPTKVIGDPCADCNGNIQSATPEPISFILAGSGLAMLGLMRLRRRR